MDAQSARALAVIAGWARSTEDALIRLGRSPIALDSDLERAGKAYITALDAYRAEVAKHQVEEVAAANAVMSENIGVNRISRDRVVVPITIPDPLD